MKDGVRIINCARGGLVVEADLIAALKSGKVAGAGIDVFEVEPATDNALFGMENVVCTPHLGASTTEAQENVALQIAEQMSDYLVKGAVSNAINMPSITAEEAPRLKPFIKLAEVLGAFVGQVTEDPIKEVEILFDGSTAAMNTRALISATLAGLIRPQVADVNMVSAPIMAKERGIILSEVKRDKSGVFDGYIKLTVKTEHLTRAIAGTCFSDHKPRFIQIKGINLDAEVGRHMLYTTNADAPGIIGLLGTVCGENGVNIANFSLGRNRPGGDAIALLYLDAPFPEPILEKVRAPQVDRIRRSGCSSTSRGCEGRFRSSLSSSFRPLVSASQMPPNTSTMAIGVVGAEFLAEDDDRQQRAEDRHQVDEQAGAVGADQLDAAYVEDLREDRREDRRVGDDRPALRVGQDARAIGEFGGDERQRRDERRRGEHDHQALPMDVRLAAQRHRVAAVDDDASSISASPKLTSSCSSRSGSPWLAVSATPAIDSRKPTIWPAVARSPNSRKLSDEDQHRNAGLLDADIDRRGVLHAPCRARR